MSSNGTNTNMIELAFLEVGLKIDRNNLHEAFETQPEMAKRVNDIYAMAVSKRDGCKDEIKLLEAQTYLRVKDASKEKLTEGAIKAAVDTDPAVMEKKKEYNGKCYDCDVALGLKEAYTTRSYVLKELAQLWANGYFQTYSASPTLTREVQERQIAEQRALLAKGRADRFKDVSETDSRATTRPRVVEDVE